MCLQKQKIGQLQFRESCKQWQKLNRLPRMFSVGHSSDLVDETTDKDQAVGRLSKWEPQLMF